MTNFASAGLPDRTLRTTITGTLSVNAYVAPTVPTTLPTMSTHGLDHAKILPMPGPVVHPTVNENIKDLATTKADDIGDVWFEKILIFPNPVNYGIITGDVSIDLEILNNYRDQDVTWDTFTNNSVDTEVALTTPTLPYTIVSLGTYVQETTVDGVGNPSVDGTLDFVFSTESLSVPVLGTRAVLFPHQPEYPVQENMVFKTAVIKKFDGTEQRYQARRAPRQTLDLRVVFEDTVERDQMLASLHKWHGKPWAVPLWHEEKQPTSAITAGDTTIQVDTTEGEFVAGGLVTVWVSGTEYETFQIDSKTTTEITISGTFASSYAIATTKIMPVKVGYLTNEVQGSRYTLGPMEATFRFTLVGNTFWGSGGFAQFSTLNGSPVVDLPNVMSGETKEDGSVTRFTSADYPAQDIKQAPAWINSKPYFGLRFLANRDQEAAWDLRRFFHNLRGRRTAFYLPTGRKDLRMNAAESAASTTLDFDYINATDYYDGAAALDPRAAMRIVRTDGTTSNHTITQFVVVTPDVTERVTFTPGLAADLDPADVERIEFLTLCRLRSDTVQATHKEPGLSEFYVQVIGVPE